jgi:glutamate racemase
MDNRPVGIFDSGVGGLTVAKHIYRELPRESTIYLGDTARLPYGTRSPQTIVTYSLQIANYLLKLNIKALVVACATASSHALSTLEKKCPVPVIGVIKAPAKTAAGKTKSGQILVIGTGATIASRSWEKALLKFKPGLTIKAIACPLFVPLIEEGETTGPLLNLVIDKYLKSIKGSATDTTILGCTHYPLIRRPLQEYLGPGVNLINPGIDTAKNLRLTLSQKNLLVNTDVHKTRHRYYTTDSPENFIRLASKFLGRPLRHLVSKVAISSF